jgi:hypothetical protein
MKSLQSAAFLLALACSSHAQISTTLNRLPNGSEEIKIRNDSATNLFAYAVTVKQAPLSANTIAAPHVFYSDSLIEPTIQPVPASGERVVVRRWFAPAKGNLPVARVFEEPITVAGIFDDGTTFGDTALLNRLILRRSNMLLAVETALDMLVDAGNRNIAREQLTRQFGKMADYLNRWYLPPEQKIGRSLYHSIAGKLINLPAQQLGSPFPPSTFVDQETVALNRQRVALLESQPSLENATLVDTR